MVRRYSGTGISIDSTVGGFDRYWEVAPVHNEGEEMRSTPEGRARIIGKLRDSRIRIIGVDPDGVEIERLETIHNEYVHRLESGESIADITGDEDAGEGDQSD